MLLAATSLLYHTMLYILISFITLIAFRIPWFSALSINCCSHQNHQHTFGQSYFYYDAGTCSTYGTFNNSDLTFNINQPAFILQFSRAVTSHTADNIPESKTYYMAPIYSGRHFMLGHCMSHSTSCTYSSVQCFSPGHTTRYMSVTPGHTIRYTSVMPGHTTRYTSFTPGHTTRDTSVMPGHTTCYMSKSSVQRCVISARYMSVISGYMTHYMSVMHSHMTNYTSDMPEHTMTHYMSESSVQHDFKPSHATYYAPIMSGPIKCCFISHRSTYYTSYTLVQGCLIPVNKKIVFLYLYSRVSLLWFWPIFAGLGRSSITAQNRNFDIEFVGGGRCTRASYEFLKPFIISTEHLIKNPENYSYIFDGHGSFEKAMQKIKVSGEKYILCNVPLSVISDNLTTGQANEVAKEHNLHALSRKSLAEKQLAVKSHICTKFCMQSFTLFKAVNKNLKSIRQQNNTKEKKSSTHPTVGKKSRLESSRIERNHKYYTKRKVNFPPSPPSQRLMHKIISGFCDDTHPSKFEEAGCAVCGQLVVISNLIKLSDIKCSLDPLVRTGVTRLPRSSTEEPIKEIHGPVIDANCKHVCHKCITFLTKKTIPPTALANGLWVGDVPKELSDLTFVERLLVARVRSNRCIVHVLKGGWKMRANAIMFPSPIPKICNILPPPLEELDEVIAFMFTGVAQPTADDMKRTPMLARRRYISAALEWLKLNHSDYADVQISQENLKLYPEEGPPVMIDYRSSIINKHKEETSVFDMEEEEGVQDGECSFVVHGITGENYSTLSKDATKAGTGITTSHQ